MKLLTFKNVKKILTLKPSLGKLTTHITIMSVNGEIYNHEELETELKKKNPNLFDAFTTDSDCEVLLHLYKTKG